MRHLTEKRGGTGHVAGKDLEDESVHEPDPAETGESPKTGKGIGLAVPIAWLVHRCPTAKPVCVFYGVRLMAKRLGGVVLLLPMSTTLENTIYDIVRDSIKTHCEKRLSESYQSPLDPFLKQAIDKHAPQIQAIYEVAVAEAIVGVNLRQSLVEAFNHKLARLLISRFEGEIEKRANELRSDAAFRARLTLAIESAVAATR